jgi:hypothetical protein
MRQKKRQVCKNDNGVLHCFIRVRGLTAGKSKHSCMSAGTFAGKPSVLVRLLL